MSLTSTIYDCIAQQVADVSALYVPPMPVAYPGLHFDPPSDGLWLELAVFWNGNENYGTADEGPSIEQGFFRLNVCSRIDAGILAGQDVAEQLTADFKKGTTLGPARVETAPNIGGPLQSDDKIIIPVTVRWRATRN